MKRFAAALFLGGLAFLPLQSLQSLQSALADQPTPVASISSQQEDGHQGINQGDDHGGPQDRSREEENGFEGVIAIGLAFLIGRRSKKSK